MDPFCISIVNALYIHYTVYANFNFSLIDMEIIRADNTLGDILNCLGKTHECKGSVHCHYLFGGQMLNRKFESKTFIIGLVCQSFLEQDNGS